MIVAANDPTGGAGIAADLMTALALGVHPLPLVTATTVQDTARVFAVSPLPAQNLLNQLDALVSDLLPNRRCRVIKLGVVGSPNNAAALGNWLADYRSRYPDTQVVVDPVLASGAGDALANGDITEALIEHLLPNCSLITPNSLEAKALAAALGCTSADADDWAATLTAAGPSDVLLTGGHDEPKQPHLTNRWYRRDDAHPHCFAIRRLHGDYHGSGCRLASAIAAYLARGETMANAIALGQQAVSTAIDQAFRLGHGQLIPWLTAAPPLPQAMKSGEAA